MGITTDRTLLQRLHEGDDISWAEFYRKYRPFLMSIGLKYGFNPEDCEDLIQGTMLSLFKGKDSFEYQPQKGKFRNYLWTIVSHEAMLIRNKKAETLLDSSDEINNIAVEEEYDKLWRQTLFEEGLEILKSQIEQTTFEAFYMFAVQNRPIEDVAIALGLSNSYIYVVKKRCIEKMQKIVEQLQEKAG